MSANVADFELRLKDSVTGPAKQAADAMRRFEVQATKAQDRAQKAAERAASAQARAQERASSAAARAMAKQEAATRRLGLMQLQAAKMNEKFNAAQSKGGGFFSSFGKALPFRSIGDYAQGAFWGDLAAKGVEKAADIFIEGVRKATDFFKEGVQAIGAEQQRRAGYRLTLGAAGDHARADVEKFKGLTAFSGSQNQDLMLPLYRAGLKGQEARNAYAASLDLAAGQGKGADVGAVQQAAQLFAQIQQKGGITTRQLSSVGLGEMNLPALYKSLGDKLGVSAKVAETRAAQPGGVDPQLLRNVIYEAIEKQQGGKLGSGGKEASQSLFGQFNKLKELPMDFFEGLANSPGLKKIAAATDGFLKKLDPDGPVGRRIFAGLSNAFEFLADKIAAAFEYLSSDEFADGFGKAIEFGKNLVGIFRDVFSIAIDLGKILSDIGIGAVLRGVIATISYLIEKLEKLLALVERATSVASGRSTEETIAKFKVNHPEQYDEAGNYVGRRDVALVGGHVAKLRRGEMQILDAPQAAAKPAAGNTKTVNVHVAVDASGHDEDADASHRRAARKVARHIGSAMERAAAEGGA